MQAQEAGFWMPAVLSTDLPPGVALPVLTPDGPLALWRSQSGHLSAFADRCPHRGMRLSHGFVRGEALSCIYHGWSYGRAGNCLRIPAHPGLTPPPAIRVSNFPVAETGGLIWIAVGLPAGRPPAFEGWAPLRSITVQAGLSVVEAAAGGKADGLLEVPNGACRLLAAGQSDAQTLLHLLVPEISDADDRIAASRSAEGLRREAEAAWKRRIAA